MKFLCDRCKTRYSIGDDRVRGKILKIRCKNCANVITVREGMPEPDAGVPAAGRRNKTTTAAPIVEAEAPAPAANGKNALGAAFASAMTKPPPALEEEWYVSIDGDQSGPYSLSDAQRWVGSKPFDAELHCWSEGFDDWLPVDKVSHFRGLRKKPAPAPMHGAMPPPIPRIGGTGPARSITSAATPPRIPEPQDEPKPLFAATMASLEKGSAPAAVVSGGGAALNALRASAHVPALPKPHVNGITARGIAPNLPAVKPSPTVKGVGALAAKPLAFDASEAGATHPLAESPAFVDEVPTTAGGPEAPAARGPHLKSVNATPAPNDAFFDALAKSNAEKPKLSLAALASTNETPTQRADDPPMPALHRDAPASDPFAAFAKPAPKPDLSNVEGADELDIGEVSRVVKLADLTRPAAAKPAQKRTGAVNKLTGPVGKFTGAVPKINGTGAVPLMDAVDALPSGIPAVADVPAEPPTSHRRGMIILLISAAILLGIAAVVVIIKFNRNDDATGLGGDYEYNAERPDNPIGKRPGDLPGSGSAEPHVIPKPRPRPPTQGSAKIVDPPLGNSLRSDEIEAMARSTSATTTACFRRADKGADAIRLSDVKKIRVTFHINADGTVRPGSVTLSENGSVTLTSCIQRMVGSWRFRANAGGDFGFVFAKPD